MSEVLPVNVKKTTLPALSIALVTVLFGCDSTETDSDDGINEVRIEPQSATLSVGEEEDFSVFALSLAGDTLQDAALDFRWWSTDTTVFHVDESGLATAVGPGTAFCMVELNDAGKTAFRFTGRDSAFVTVLF